MKLQRILRRRFRQVHICYIPELRPRILQIHGNGLAQAQAWDLGPDKGVLLFYYAGQGLYHKIRV